MTITKIRQSIDSSKYGALYGKKVSRKVSQSLVNIEEELFSEFPFVMRKRKKERQDQER